jgi:hypothetical protein
VMWGRNTCEKQAERNEADGGRKLAGDETIRSEGGCRRSPEIFRFNLISLGLTPCSLTPSLHVGTPRLGRSFRYRQRDGKIHVIQTTQVQYKKRIAARAAL